MRLCVFALTLITPILAAPATTTVGTLRVERHGAGGRAIVLVPGLASGPWSWRHAIETLSKHHTVYAVTLAGFDGTPPSDGPVLDRAIASLVELIRTEKLDRPVVAGHSLGGHLALRLAVEHPDLVSAVFVVDGTPVFPAVATLEDGARRAAAERFVAPIRAATPEQYEQYERNVMRMMVTDPAAAEEATRLVLRSDRETVARAAFELLSADLRPGLGRITAPVTLVVPVPAGFDRAFVEQYRALYKGTPRFTLLPVENARHFAMIDQPEAVTSALASVAGSTR